MIIEKTTLNTFIGMLIDLDQSKMFYGPNDIFCHSRVKMTLEQLIKALTDYRDYWMNEIDEETMFSIQIEYTDGYLISMSNKDIDNFNPYRNMN